MAARRKNVTKVDVEGVSVASEGAKMATVIEYYTRSITNLDEVVAALGGGGVPAAKVFDTLGVAIQKASSKN